MSSRSHLSAVMDKKVALVERALNIVTAVFIVFLVMFSTAAVSSRYLFNYPLKGYEDFAEMIMVVIVFCSAAYAQSMGEHVRLELVIDRLKGRRAQDIIQLATTALALLVFLVIAVYGLKGVAQARSVNEVSMTIYWPVWPSKLAMVIGTVILCARFSVQLFQHAVNIRGAHQQARPPER